MAMQNIPLPELGEGVMEGELVKWLVKIGDSVKSDQALAEMMTDKATVEVPAPFPGVVKELKFKEGEVVAVGAVMVVVESAGATATPSAHAAAKATPASSAPGPMAASSAAASASVSSAAGVEVHPPAAESRVLATPATRRLAREMGVDINGVRGSGLAGRVTREDVAGARGAGASTQSPKAASAAALQMPSLPRPAVNSAPGAAEERVPLRGVRKKIAENLQLAKQIVPHFTLMDEANVTALVNLREELKPTSERLGVKITYLPFVMKALIATIREFPMFNASIDDAAQEIVYKKYFNLGFAADTPNGLLVPVIKDADRKTVVQLAREITDLAKRARDGKLALDEMRGATITLTNIGSVGGTYATPIINHPEVAILGLYKIQDKPVVKKGPEGVEIEVIKTMNFTITADHRLIDGAVAANFLRAFIARVESPGALILDMV